MQPEMALLHDRGLANRTSRGLACIYLCPATYLTMPAEPYLVVASELYLRDRCRNIGPRRFVRNGGWAVGDDLGHASSASSRVQLLIAPARHPILLANAVDAENTQMSMVKSLFQVETTVCDMPSLDRAVALKGGYTEDNPDHRPEAHRPECVPASPR